MLAQGSVRKRNKKNQNKWSAKMTDLEVIETGTSKMGQSFARFTFRLTIISMLRALSLTKR